jgi:hypothetical protein
MIFEPNVCSSTESIKFRCCYSTSQFESAASHVLGPRAAGEYSEPARTQYEPGSWSLPSANSGTTREQLKPLGHSQ